MRKCCIAVIVFAFVVMISVAGYATPTLVSGTTYTEIGNDVKVDFTIADPAGYDSCPHCFIVRLYEEDIIWDDLLGSYGLTLNQDDVTMTGLHGAGYSVNLSHTFANASNAYTGWGDEYILTITEVDCPIPEPATMFLFGFGIVGLCAVRVRSRLRRNHS